MTLIDAFNLFANQYPAANMMPMNSPQTYLLQNLLAQQSMQPKQNPLLSFINRAGMAANNPGQSRIAQLIFGPNQSANHVGDGTVVPSSVDASGRCLTRLPSWAFSSPPCSPLGGGGRSTFSWFFPLKVDLYV